MLLLAFASKLKHLTEKVEITFQHPTLFTCYNIIHIYIHVYICIIHIYTCGAFTLIGDGRIP